MEEDRHLPGSRRAVAPGVHVVPLAQRGGILLEALRLPRARHPPVRLEPVILQVRRDLARAPAQRPAVQAALASEGRVDLQEAVVRRAVRRVEEDLHHAEPFVERLEERAVLLLARPQGQFRGPALGKVREHADDARGKAVHPPLHHPGRLGDPVDRPVRPHHAVFLRVHARRPLDPRAQRPLHPRQVLGMDDRGEILVAHAPLGFRLQAEEAEVPAVPVHLAGAVVPVGRA